MKYHGTPGLAIRNSRGSSNLRPWGWLESHGGSSRVFYPVYLSQANGAWEQLFTKEEGLPGKRQCHHTQRTQGHCLFSLLRYEKAQRADLDQLCGSAPVGSHKLLVWQGLGRSWFTIC